MTEHENGTGEVRALWTDAELDAALAALHAQPETNPQALADAGAQLLAAVNESSVARVKPRRPKWAWLASAAAVAVVATVGVVVADTLKTGAPPVPAAGPTLQAAAGATVNEQDTPI